MENIKLSDTINLQIENIEAIPKVCEVRNFNLENTKTGVKADISVLVCHTSVLDLLRKSDVLRYIDGEITYISAYDYSDFDQKYED